MVRLLPLKMIESMYLLIFKIVSALLLRKGHVSKAFLRRPFEMIFSKQWFLSGSTIYPSNTVHTVATAFWANTDINFPDSFY